MTRDEERARIVELLALWNVHADLDDGIVDHFVKALAEVRREERARLIEQIRTHATEVTLFAKGRALDLMAWILSLDESPIPSTAEVLADVEKVSHAK